MSRKRHHATIPAVVMERAWINNPAARPGAGRPIRLRSVHAADQLEYLADLIGELHTMAIGAGCSRLAQLLAEANAEARSQIDSHER